MANPPLLPLRLLIVFASPLSSQKRKPRSFFSYEPFHCVKGQQAVLLPGPQPTPYIQCLFRLSKPNIVVRSVVVFFFSPTRVSVSGCRLPRAHSASRTTHKGCIPPIVRLVLRRPNTYNRSENLPFKYTYFSFRTSMQHNYYHGAPISNKTFTYIYVMISRVEKNDRCGVFTSRIIKKSFPQETRSRRKE